MLRIELGLVHVSPPPSSSFRSNEFSRHSRRIGRLLPVPHTISISPARAARPTRPDTCQTSFRAAPKRQVPPSLCHADVLQWKCVILCNFVTCVSICNNFVKSVILQHHSNVVLVSDVYSFVRQLFLLQCTMGRVSNEYGFLKYSNFAYSFSFIFEFWIYSNMGSWELQNKLFRFTIHPQLTEIWKKPLCL